ncbi:hypothetical protein PR048_010124 [Dryococelus australis]|uniref:Uncharacterized protein n=1 Tax=Dryococelus australis TaxID=614101 RepID=A0ABQ9I1T7_9NEOP|nr:hypothetical protein PR048_010124 [Dryococelus australis]
MDPFYFQDDNARCHISRATMQWYADNNFRRMDWPAQSPDLSPIEHGEGSSGAAKIHCSTHGMVAREMATNPRGCPANTRRQHARQGGCCYSRKRWPYEILTGRTGRKAVQFCNTETRPAQPARYLYPRFTLRPKHFQMPNPGKCEIPESVSSKISHSSGLPEVFTPCFNTPVVCSLTRLVVYRTSVVPDGMLAYSKSNRSIAGRFTLDFRKWESCRTMPLVGGCFRGSPVSHGPLSIHCSVLTLTSPSSALKTSMFSVAQIFSLTHKIHYTARRRALSEKTERKLCILEMLALAQQRLAKRGFKPDLALVKWEDIHQHSHQSKWMNYLASDETRIYSSMDLPTKIHEIGRVLAQWLSVVALWCCPPSWLASQLWWRLTPEMVDHVVAAGTQVDVQVDDAVDTAEEPDSFSADLMTNVAEGSGNGLENSGSYTGALTEETDDMAEKHNDEEEIALFTLMRFQAHIEELLGDKRETTNGKPYETEHIQ